MESFSIGEILLVVPFVIAFFIILLKDAANAVKCYREGSDYKYYVQNIFYLFCGLVLGTLIVFVVKNLTN